MHAVAALRDLRLSTLSLGSPQALAAVLQHTQLTRLWLLQTEAGRGIAVVLPEALARLPPAHPVLPRLASLFLGYNRHSSAESFLKELPDPARLTYLGLVACLSSVPSTLSAFTSLAALHLSGNTDAERFEPLHGVDRLAALGGSLTHLDISHCRLAAIPDVLSRLTHVERLVPALCVLCVLYVSLRGALLREAGAARSGPLWFQPAASTAPPPACMLLHVGVETLCDTPIHAPPSPPLQELRCNRHLAGGWQHLQRLTRLTALDLSRSRLDTAALVPLLASLPRLQSFSAANCGTWLPATVANALAARPLTTLAVQGNTLLRAVPEDSEQPAV